MCVACINAVNADVYVNAFYKNDVAHTSTKYAQEWIDKCALHLQEKNWSEAIRTATIAISIDPNFDIPYVSRAWAYVEIGFIDRAITDANIALELNPKSGAAYNNRGYAYQMAGELEQAERDYATACKLDEPMGCKNLQEYANTLSTEPDKKFNHLANRSDEKFDEQQWDAIIHESNNILTGDPKNIIALVNRSRAYAEMGNLDMALKDSLVALEFDPHDSRLHHNRAYIYGLKGDASNAHREYTISCDLGFDKSCRAAEKISSIE